MSKTYRRDSQYRQKKHGRIFVKDQSWKKNKKQKPINDERQISTPDVYNELNP